MFFFFFFFFFKGLGFQSLQILAFQGFEVLEFLFGFFSVLHQEERRHVQQAGFLTNDSRIQAFLTWGQTLNPKTLKPKNPKTLKPKNPKTLKP